MLQPDLSARHWLNQAANIGGQGGHQEKWRWADDDLKTALGPEIEGIVNLKKKENNFVSVDSFGGHSLREWAR